MAETLLHVWIGGDPVRLERELDRAESASVDSRDSEEGERLQLLKAVACRMRSCPDLFASRSADLGLDVCVDMLVHLAGGNPAGIP